MNISTQIVYNGNCRDVLKHYGDIFGKDCIRTQTYAEMPHAEMYGISGANLELIWRSIVRITIGNYAVCLELSDSMLHAMGASSIENPYVHSNKIYPQIYFGRNNAQELDELTKVLNLDSGNTDSYGVQWLPGEIGKDCIYLHFEFDGFCEEVLHHYSTAFGVKPESVVRYGSSPHKDTANGTDKIYFAVIEFANAETKYAISLCDTLESAKANQNTYDPTALLFYKSCHNPLLNIKECEFDTAKKAFDSLSGHGKLNKPFAQSDADKSWNGCLIDRYGICWDITVAK